MVKHQPAEIRQKQILMAAMAVCGQKGYHQARIEDIAEWARLSKGAIYHHFKSKRDIYVAVLEWLLDEASSELKSLDQAGLSVRESLRQVTQRQFDMARANPELVRGLLDLCLMSFREPEFRSRFRAHYQNLLDATQEIVQHGIDRGELAAHVDAETAARMLIVGGDGLVFMNLVIGPDADPATDDLGERALDLFNDILLAGLQKGAGS